MAIPTKLPIKYKCGHTEKSDLSKVPPGKRKSRAKFYGQKFDCKKCFTSQQAADKDQAARARAIEAEAFGEEHSLPELDGSEKQIKWALIIRHETLSAVLDTEADDSDEVLDAARQIRWAGWWLDNLNWHDRQENNYDAADFSELILTGPAAQQERDQTHIETENPYE